MQTIRRSTQTSSTSINNVDLSYIAQTLVSLSTASLSSANNILSDSTKRQYASAMTFRIGWFISQYLYRQTSFGSNMRLQAPTAVTGLLQAVSKQVLGVNLDFIDTLTTNSSISVEEQERVKNLREAFFSAFVDLLQTDLDHISCGRYNLPYDLNVDLSNPQWNPIHVFNTLQKMNKDIPKIKSRRDRKDGTEVSRNFLTYSDRYPDYYLQNFHYQTDGWLSSFSAELYDYQVESLFFGLADVMRRQIIPDFNSFYKQNEKKEEFKHLDVACGTGRFASFVLDNNPSLQSTLLDLSPFYLAEAKKSLADKFPETQFCEAMAEKMPFPDNSFDAITCVYLFHELPEEVRKVVVSEMFRVLRPGGKVFFLDSAQENDISYRQVFLGFASGFHEPFYLNYIQTDLEELFKSEGFQVERNGVHWLSKSIVAVKQ